MRRFKSGWVLVPVGSLAIGIAITTFSQGVRSRGGAGQPESNLKAVESANAKGRTVEDEKSSKPGVPIKEESLRTNHPEKGAILEQLGPLLREPGQTARLEDPTTRSKAPIRIRTH